MEITDRAWSKVVGGCADNSHNSKFSSFYEGEIPNRSFSYIGKTFTKKILLTPLQNNKLSMLSIVPGETIVGSCVFPTQVKQMLIVKIYFV